MPNGPAAVPQPRPDETRPPLPLTPTWTTQRRRLLHWLRQKAPSLAELYETAVTLLEEQSLPGRSRIIAHCVREIANALPALRPCCLMLLDEFFNLIEEILSQSV